MADWSVRRIEKIRYIVGASSYLEVGVSRGDTFHKVGISHKDAVDPKFRFDVARHAAHGVRFFEQKSDDFWSSGRARIYDVIMLDGLHTFEQTARDLLCSLRYGHPRTVWLIDDTMPSDMLSALKDQRAAQRQREKLKLSGSAWHGDVYKLVPFIHDFLPVMDYGTIVGSGNPQTVAWYANAPHAAVMNDLERISRLSYFDIEGNLPLFRTAAEDDVMSRLESSLGS